MSTPLAGHSKIKKLINLLGFIIFSKFSKEVSIFVIIGIDNCKTIWKNSQKLKYLNITTLQKWGHWSNNCQKIWINQNIWILKSSQWLIVKNYVIKKWNKLFKRWTTVNKIYNSKFQKLSNIYDYLISIYLSFILRLCLFLMTSLRIFIHQDLKLSLHFHYLSIRQMQHI